MIEDFLKLKLPTSRVNYKRINVSRHNPFFHKWFPTKRCMRAIKCAKFLGQCTPWNLFQMRLCEEPLSMKHHQAGGLGMNGMENIYELLFKASSKKSEAKDADKP